MCQHMRRTHEHTRNYCPCDFMKLQLGALRRLVESFWPDWNSICDSCQKKMIRHAIGRYSCDRCDHSDCREHVWNYPTFLELLKHLCF